MLLLTFLSIAVSALHGNRTHYSNYLIRNGSSNADVKYKDSLGDVTLLLPLSQMPSEELKAYQQSWAFSNRIRLLYKPVDLAEAAYTKNITDRCTLAQSDYDVLYVDAVDVGALGNKNCLLDVFAYNFVRSYNSGSWKRNRITDL
jgi:hypothetical protein